MTVRFAFHESIPTVPGDDEMIAKIRAGIAEVAELYDVLTEAPQLPDYFGRNWDALDEVLRDLWWLVPRRVTLVHEDLPDLTVDERRVYLDIPRSGVEEWQQRPGAHELVVTFPNAEQLAIRRMLA